MHQENHGEPAVTSENRGDRLIHSSVLFELWLIVTATVFANSLMQWESEYGFKILILRGENRLFCWY